MTSKLFAFAAITALALGAAGCSKKGKAKGMPDNGQLVGASYGNIQGMTKPIGMVYVPPGTFHMGPSDEDVNFNFTARNKQVSISGFWMDATEITNNEYRQFVYYVRDSLASIRLGYMKTSTSGDTAIDWKKAASIKWNDRNTLEKLNDLILSPDNRLYGKMDLDPEMIVYNV